MPTLAETRLPIHRSAVVEPPYRYLLSRTWWNYQGAPRMTYVMLNPSIADSQVDDQTIRRCMLYAHRDGYGGIDVVNLYSLISTDPKALKTHPFPVGPKTAGYWEKPLRHNGFVVVAWGANKMATPDRVAELRRAARRPLFCLGMNADGSPKHPARLGNDVRFELWK